MLCEKGESEVNWVFWYLFIGLCVGAYGKATAGPYNGALLADIIALLVFVVFWPVVFYWIITGKKRT